MSDEVVLGAWLAVAIFAAVVASVTAYRTERRARDLQQTLDWHRRQSAQLALQVDQLLRTRRRATRERVLGLIEESRTDG